ncbi:sensor histidine kinase [Spirosoma sp. KNUC1025]|uniref:sensor histidine kinase n=1 Tax=Spirosoma sp. KNUC1025 TaxID=2894082 RepID=UPI003870AAFD|nr:histidine kinase [Spirosoma sp. KNUC1025]
MERPNDKWIRWIGIPLSVLLANLIYLEEYQYDYRRYFGWALFGMVYVALLCEMIVWWLMFVRQRYAAIHQTRLRILITFVGYLVLTTVFQMLFVWVTDKTGIAPIPVTPQVYIVYFITGFVCVILVGSVYEVIYYLRKYREAVQEAEAVKKVGLQSQYDSLKNQVNPHFLFNALTSLSALISEDQRKASLFLDELASVYRYLLQAGQHPLVTLSDEVTFLTSFRYLLDARFGPTIRWQIAIDDRFLNRWLPPLTLQTVIDNALRHNCLLPDSPLKLTIRTTDDGYLEVSNSIQRKKVTLSSPQRDLIRLAAHFDVLDLPKPIISDDNQLFTVRIPLVSKEIAEQTTPLRQPVAL